MSRTFLVAIVQTTGQVTVVDAAPEDCELFSVRGADPDDARRQVAAFRQRGRRGTILSPHPIPMEAE